MTNHRSKGGTENNPYPSDFYDCSTYTLAHQKRTHACSGHYIRTKAVRELVLETIRTASAFAIANQDEFMKKVRSASQIRQAEVAKDTKRKLNKDRRRIAELDTIIKKLYESFAIGRITDERFDTLLAEYEAEQKALVTSVSEAESHLSSFEEDTDRAAQFHSLAKKYTDFSELTTPMINEFIEKIIVHAPEKIDGDRVQEVEIYLKFIGRFELPEPELTPEQRLALYRSEVLQLLNTGRTVPFSAPASALSDAAQTRAEELQQTGRLSHKRPNGEDYTSLLPGSNLPGFVSKELYASGQATPAEFVSHLKTRRSGVDWETILDTQYTQIGIGYAVDADGVPYWELLLLNG